MKSLSQPEKERNGRHEQQRHIDQTRQPSRQGPTAAILALHQAAGNRAVSQLVQQQSVVPAASTLTIASPHDRHEQEADQAAESVLTAATSTRQTDRHLTPAPAATVQRKCACGAALDTKDECTHCQQQRLAVQRKATSDGTPATAPTIVEEVLRSPGQPLDPATRATLAPRLGHDFPQVRLHTTAQAAAAAHAIHAHAYTVGHHIVFGAGQYQPGTVEGTKLIAHELVHVLQQTQSANARATSTLPVVDQHHPSEGEAQHFSHSLTLARQPTTIGPVVQRAGAPTITDVEVNQTAPQRVTIRWSDGRTDTDPCSTGKGHCCLDESAATGSNCSASGSQAANSNCTPIGDFRVTRKLPASSGGVPLWTQFHDGRSIALHEYRPVDGTPLSHGCVRLNRPMAQKIYTGAVAGQTKVHVRNLAQPRCNHPTLQNEWRNDFGTAGRTPPDGEAINPATGARYTRTERARARRSIERERADLRSALGVDDRGLDEAVAAVQQASPKQADVLQANIPRCLPTQTVEEARAPTAVRTGVATKPTQLSQFQRALKGTDTMASARRVVRRFGEALWSHATQQGAQDVDDRALYWARLQMTPEIRQFTARWLQRLNPDNERRTRQELVELFEQTSRGFTTAAFTRQDRSHKQILISGFDPFGLDAGQGGALQRSNPSGAAVLSLDNQILRVGRVSARVQGVIFPVRFADFDAGMVEAFFRPHLTGAEPVDLIMTISMGGSGDFELETVAGRRRSSLAPDNVGQAGNPGSRIPPVAPGMEEGPEFLRTNLLEPRGRRLQPTDILAAMRQSLGRRAPLPGETNVQEIRPGETRPRRSVQGPSSTNALAVEGSGGGYLSNEIFYRTSFLRTQNGVNVPVIHLHTPYLAVNADPAQRQQMLTTIRRLLEAALPTL